MKAGNLGELERTEVALEALDLLMQRLDRFSTEEAALLVRFARNCEAVIASRLSGGGLPSEAQRRTYAGPEPPLELAA